MQKPFTTFRKYTQRNSFRKFGTAKSAIALVVVLSVLPACSSVTQRESTNATAENIAENANQYVGRTVTIRSEPIRKIGSNTFTMSSQQFLGGEPILVVNATGRPLVLPADNNLKMQVTGQVRQFTLADINRDYRLGLDAGTYQEFENQPAIIAQSAALSPEPGELAQNPSRFYGQRIAVSGAVEDVRNSNAFTMDEDNLFGGQDLLVFNPNPRQAIQDDQTVVVTGVLRPFVIAELERETAFNWNQGFVQQLEAEYRNRPVLVADTVYPSALPEDNGAIWGLLGLAGLAGLFGLASGRRSRDNNRNELRDAPAYRNPSIR